MTCPVMHFTITEALFVWITILKLRAVSTEEFEFPDKYLLLTVNSVAPGRFQISFRWVILKLTLVNGGWGISYEIVLRCH